MTPSTLEAHRGQIKNQSISITCNMCGNTWEPLHPGLLLVYSSNNESSRDMDVASSNEMCGACRKKPLENMKLFLPEESHSQMPHRQ
jgi:hypothetical protein